MILVGRKRDFMNKTKVSKRLSFLLRHCKNPLYIDLDGGWALVDDILDVLQIKYPDISRKILDDIVDSDEKMRYSYDQTGRKIRANQGHSIPGVIVHMEKPKPPEFLYHGTTTRFLNGIMKEGLKPMSRQWVHISSDVKTAIKVGKRHGIPVVLKIHARKFVQDGHELYLSPNGVWQAKSVPAEYLEIQDV